jgi:hypothetical protein
MTRWDPGSYSGRASAPGVENFGKEESKMDCKGLTGERLGNCLGRLAIQKGNKLAESNGPGSSLKRPQSSDSDSDDEDATPRGRGSGSGRRRRGGGGISNKKRKTKLQKKKKNRRTKKSSKR